MQVSFVHCPYLGSYVQLYNNLTLAMLFAALEYLIRQGETVIRRVSPL